MLVDPATAQLLATILPASLAALAKMADHGSGDTTRIGDDTPVAPGELVAAVSTTTPDAQIGQAAMAAATTSANGGNGGNGGYKSPIPITAQSFPGVQDSALKSRLPEQAADGARLSHSIGPEAANPAGRPLPMQAIDKADPALAREATREAAPDFAALIERATTELATQPATAQATVARGDAPASYRIEAPAGQQNRWAQEIGDRVAWMVTSREQRAELVLNPPQLGRIEVTLSVNGDQANAWFSSPNSAVRELLETSLPRLREVMADAGIQLGQAQVGADNRGFTPQSGDQRREGASGPHASATESGHIRSNSTATVMSGGRGMVDIFA